MLGLRGCRLGIMIPELVEMQTRAFVEAALNNKYLKGLNPKPEIMIPLVSTATEYTHQAALIRNTITTILAERVGQVIDVKVGTMLETPRATLTATEISGAGAEFFSYGTNDLTQMTFGISRDDVGKFMPTYVKQGIFKTDPFETIDEAGVGYLIHTSFLAGKEHARKLAEASGTSTLRPTSTAFKAGVCGEHGGDPASVKYFSRIGLDYVSCSPFRVPLARLAAAQAVIEKKGTAEARSPKYFDSNKQAESRQLAKYVDLMLRLPSLLTRNA